MKGPLLVIDADMRFAEVARYAANGVYKISDSARENTHPYYIAEKLKDVEYKGTIIVDSLTSILTPIVLQAIMDKSMGKTQNLAAAFKDKAVSMRFLADRVTHTGADVLWVWHLDMARDSKGQEAERQSVSRTELVRLTRNLNAKMRTVRDKNKLGIKVDWARCGRWGMTLWDDTGTWEGMPEKLEEAMYLGYNTASFDEKLPEMFPDPETAIAWGMDLDVFEDIQHATNAYEKVKKDARPTSAREMAAAWVVDVLRRQREITGGG